MMPVREFIQDCYRLISAHTPTAPLYGDDLSLGIRKLNQVLASYSGNGLLITVAETQRITVNVGQTEVTSGSPDDLPEPNMIDGRLANLANAWLEFSGVTYPLDIVNNDIFFSGYRVENLLGLPCMVVPFYDRHVTRVRLYPAPSQPYELFLQGKWQIPRLRSTDDMSAVPEYYIRFLMFATAKDIAFSKGRSEAWTEKLEAEYRDARDEMVGVSDVNLELNYQDNVMLAGAARVKAGV